MAFLRVLVRIGVVPKSQNIVGHFLEKHDLKFEVLPTSDALGTTPNRSAVVELPMAGIVAPVRQHAYPCRKNTPAHSPHIPIFSQARSARQVNQWRLR